MLISGCPQGSDITVMNVYYQYPKKNPETGKYGNDKIFIVYKDNNTGLLHHQEISKPEYTYYKLKDEYGESDHHLLYIEKDKVEPITCRYRELEKSIAENFPYDHIYHMEDQYGNDIVEEGYHKKGLTNFDFYKDNLYNSEFRKDNRKLHTITRVFRSDIAVEDYYRLLFGAQYTNEIKKINRAFFDIEVEGRWRSSEFVKPGECPVNAISLHDERTDTIFTYLLRDSRNPQIYEFEEEYMKNSVEYQEVIRAFVEQAIGGRKKLIRNKLEKTKFILLFYDDEVQLLKDFFENVHKLKPDFIEGWNSSGFDLPYIIARCEALGIPPEEVMCDTSWKDKIVKHYIDQKNLSNFAERGDYTFISGETVWMDQMIQFASRRKSKIGSFTSFKLDDIGERIANVKKLDYHHITTDIAMLPWLNYKVFVLYNIFDVIVQKCIELKTQDLDYIFAKCVVNNTSYRKGHRQTVYLINRMAKEFDALGYIIGNNNNRWNPEPDKFLGALVGDPTHLNDYSKMKINGKSIMVAETLQDYDYKSLYPSIDLENNIAPNTQLGLIRIPEKVYDNENMYSNDKYSRGGEFIENMVTDNIIEFCKRWFHLASIKDLIKDVNEYFSKKYFTCNSVGTFDSYYYDKDGKFIDIPLRCSRGAITPITINHKAIHPIRCVKPRKRG